jgi:hypothetical protein
MQRVYYHKKEYRPEQNRKKRGKQPANQKKQRDKYHAEYKVLYRFGVRFYF